MIHGERNNEGPFHMFPPPASLTSLEYALAATGSNYLGPVNFSHPSLILNANLGWADNC